MTRFDVDPTSKLIVSVLAGKPVWLACDKHFVCPVYIVGDSKRIFYESLLFRELIRLRGIKYQSVQGTAMADMFGLAGNYKGLDL